MRIGLRVLSLVLLVAGIVLVALTWLSDSSLLVSALLLIGSAVVALGMSLLARRSLIVREASTRRRPRLGDGLPSGTDLTFSAETGRWTPVDDDVQFTAFRPTRVRPDEWYQLLLFVHKGSVYIGADGEQKDPFVEVAHQANALLGLARPEYADVRSESLAALSRGTALTLVPWAEKGQVNPGSVRLDWYEPIHRHEFRLRLPRAAEGERVSGGVRIFRDLLLIGEVRFSITVDPAAPVPGASPAVRVSRPGPSATERSSRPTRAATMTSCEGWRVMWRPPAIAISSMFKHCGRGRSGTTA